MAYTPSGILYVALTAGDEVDVAVEDRLSRSIAAVHTNVEPFDGPILAGDCVTKLTQEIGAGIKFCPSQAEEVADVPLRDHQSVQASHWEAITDRVGKIVVSDDSFVRYSTEKAAIGFGSHVTAGAHVYVRLSSLPAWLLARKAASAGMPPRMCMPAKEIT